MELPPPGAAGDVPQAHEAVDGGGGAGDEQGELDAPDAVPAHRELRARPEPARWEEKGAGPAGDSERGGAEGCAPGEAPPGPRRAREGHERAAQSPAEG